jgi:hypothetical protein
MKCYFYSAGNFLLGFRFYTIECNSNKQLLLIRKRSELSLTPVGGAAAPFQTPTPLSVVCLVPLMLKYALNRTICIKVIFAVFRILVRTFGKKNLIDHLRCQIIAFTRTNTISTIRLFWLQKIWVQKPKTRKKVEKVTFFEQKSL